MAAEKPPIDEAARVVVREGHDKSLFVEAGAGSGKTRAVVERIVELIRHGTDIGHIAAITFTEAAATELRIRVGDTLEGEAAKDDKCARALLGLDTAAFTTVHGFALRLLSSFPIAAGLPPEFTVADEVNSILTFDRSWTGLRGRVGDDENLADLQERSSALDTPLTKFVGMAHFFDDNWDQLDRIPRSLPELSPIDLDDLIGEMVALADLADSCSDPDDKLAIALREISSLGRSLEAAEPIEQLRHLQSGIPSIGRKGQKPNWSQPTKEEVAETVGSIGERLQLRVGRYTDEVLRSWAAVLADFTDAQVQERIERGELGFHDLLVLARKLLREHPEERDRLASQYQYLLLDEFQDTDPIQIELAVLLCHPGPVGRRPWPELAEEIRPGSLVVVGDPKQSIYRFRRADFKVYATAQDTLAADHVSLTVNFRSRPGILEWVNGVFGEAMGDGKPGAQPPYVALDDHREPDLGPDDPIGGPVWTIGSAHEAVAASEIRKLEAADVVAACAKVVEEGWTVVGSKVRRPAKLNDIAVLIPSRLSLPSLEEAFQKAGVPLRPETRSLVYATAEVTEVLNGVRAVAHPEDKVALAAALRSPLFNVSDAELVRWHQAGGRWDYRLPLLDLPGSPVAAAFVVLRRWYDRRLWTDPAALIRMIITERRMRELALAQPRHRDRWRRYRFITEQARAFSAQAGGDLQDFVVWADLQASESAGVAEPIPAETDDEAVRVLTVHGAKGLEFPVVVLAGAPTVERSGSRGVQVLFDDHGGFELRVKAGRSTESFDSQAAIEAVMSAEERVRLQYVAATRARDHLIVSTHHKLAKSSNSAGSRWQEWITASGAPCSQLELDLALEHSGSGPTAQVTMDGGQFERAVETYRAHRQRVRAKSQAAQATSPTRLAAALRPDEGERAMVPSLSESAEATIEPEAKGSAFGTAVHQVLAEIDLANPTDIRERSERAATAAGVDNDAPEIASRVRFALKSPIVRHAATTTHHKELPVVVPWGEGLLEGYIDLLVAEGDGYVIVDYKTDALGAAGQDGLDALAKRYEAQAAAYAEAVEAVTRRPVRSARFVVLTANDAREVEVNDLDGVRARLRALVD